MLFKEWVEKEIKDTCEAIIRLVALDLNTTSEIDMSVKVHNYAESCDYI